MRDADKILTIIDELEELRANVLLEGMDEVAANLNKAIADLMWLHRELGRFE